MAKQTINIGTNQDDGTGDLLRVAFSKVNDNFTEIYNELGGTDLSSISFNANVISTDTTNMDIVLSPSGAGEVDISADSLIRGDLVVTGQSRSNNLQVDSNAQIDGTLNVTGAATFGAITIGSTIASDLNVSGAVTVGGLFTANGSVDLGDTSADTITYVGRVDSSIVPSVTQNNDLGSATLKWRDLYLRDVDARNGTFSGNVDVTGNVTIGGNITIGDSTTDSITIESDLSSNIIPDVDSTYSIGSDAKRYLNLFGDFVHTTDLRTADLSVSGSTITTLTTNTDLTLDAAGTGVVRATKLEVADLTTGRVVTTTTDGRLQDSAGLTWNGTRLGATEAAIGEVTIVSREISTTSGNITINPTGNVDFNNNLLVNVQDPTSAQDAATKSYVDSQVAGNSLTIVDDTSTSFVIGPSEILGIVGGADISSLASGDVLTIANTSTLDSVLGRGATTTTAITLNGGITTTTISATSTITSDSTVTGNRIETSGIRIEDNNIITLNSNDNINLIPSGTGNVALGTLVFDADQAVGSGEDNYVLTYDHASGTIRLESNAGSGSAISNVVEDITPQLGGDLDLNSNNITGTGNVNITGNVTSTGTVDADTVTTDGISITDNNITSSRSNDNIVLDPSGTGAVQVVGNLTVSGSISGTISGSVTGTVDADTATVSNLEVDNFKATAIVIESEGIGSNDNDTTLPTSAAVKDYVDTNSQGAIATAGNTGSGSIGVGDTLQALGTTNEITVDAAGSALSFSLADDISGVTSVTVSGSLNTEGIQIVDNNITSSRSNDDIILDPSGTGAVTITSNLSVTGTISGTVSGTIDADSATVSNLEVDNFKGSAIVLESEGIASNDNDTTIPTSAAVKDYVDNNAVSASTATTFTANVLFDTGVQEAFDTLTGSTGTVTHNCDNGHVFYHTGASGDITANFTNLGLTAEYGTNVTVIINQGATPYEVTAVQIGGVGQTINWQGGTPPTGNANGIDSFNFTILNDGGTYVVLGQMVDFT